MLKEIYKQKTAIPSKQTNKQPNTTTDPPGGGRQERNHFDGRCPLSRTILQTFLPWSFVSPWYNRTGWLGVKHRLTYLFTWSLAKPSLYIASLSNESYKYHASPTRSSGKVFPFMVFSSQRERNRQKQMDGERQRQRRRKGKTKRGRVLGF